MSNNDSNNNINATGSNPPSPLRNPPSPLRSTPSPLRECMVCYEPIPVGGFSSWGMRGEGGTYSCRHHADVCRVCTGKIVEQAGAPIEGTDGRWPFPPPCPICRTDLNVSPGTVWPDLNVRPRVRTRRRVIEESESESDDAEDAEAAEAESEDAEAESEALVLPPRWWAPPREELRESEAVELFITF